MSTRNIEYLNQPLKDYLICLSSKTPTPGGGSSVAFVASISSALVSMVLNYTLGKEKYRVKERELLNIQKENNEILKVFLKYIEEDSRIYLNIRKYTKDDPILAEKFLEESLLLHFDICKKIDRVVTFLDFLAQNGNKNLFSDTLISAEFALSAFKSAEISILVNLKYMEDVELYKETLLEVAQIKKNVEEVCNKISLQGKKYFLKLQ